MRGAKFRMSAMHLSFMVKITCIYARIRLRPKQDVTFRMNFSYFLVWVMCKKQGLFRNLAAPSR